MKNCQNSLSIPEYGFAEILREIFEDNIATVEEAAKNCLVAVITVE